MPTYKGYTSAFDVRPSLEALQYGYFRNAVFALKANIMNQLIAQLNSQTQRTSKTLVAFIRAMERDAAPELKRRITIVNQEIAEHAHEAMLEKYLDSLIGTPTYRTNPEHERNRRYAGGILEGIISNSQFCTSDENGIYLADVTALNAGARQWKRLNYGAGDAAGGSAGIVSVRWSDLDAFTLEEPGSARPGFSLPPGRWVGDEFYPNSELESQSALEHIETRFGHLRDARGAIATSANRTWRPTRGIRGTHWLLAGLEVVADELPLRYGQVFKEFFNNADEKLQELVAQDTGLSRVTRLPGSTVGVSGGEAPPR